MTCRLRRPLVQGPAQLAGLRMRMERLEGSLLWCSFKRGIDCGDRRLEMLFVRNEWLCRHARRSTDVVVIFVRTQLVCRWRGSHIVSLLLVSRFHWHGRGLYVDVGFQDDAFTRLLVGWPLQHWYEDDLDVRSTLSLRRKLCSFVRAGIEIYICESPYLFSRRLATRMRWLT